MSITNVSAERTAELREFLSACHLSELHQINDLLREVPAASRNRPAGPAPPFGTPSPVRKQRRGSLVSEGASAKTRKRRTSIIDLFRKPISPIDMDKGAGDQSELRVYLADKSLVTIPRHELSGNLETDIALVLARIQEQVFAGQSRLTVSELEPFFALFALDAHGSPARSAITHISDFHRDLCYQRVHYFPDDAVEAAEMLALEGNDPAIRVAFYHAVGAVVSGTLPILSRDAVRFAALQLLVMDGVDATPEFHLRDVVSPIVKDGARSAPGALKRLIYTAYVEYTGLAAELSAIGHTDPQMKGMRTYLDLVRKLAPAGAYNNAIFDGTLSDAAGALLGKGINAKICVCHHGVTTMSGESFNRVWSCNFVDVTQWTANEEDNTFEFEVLSVKAAAAGRPGRTLIFAFTLPESSVIFDSHWQWYVDAKVKKMRQKAVAQKARRPARRTSIALTMVGEVAAEQYDKETDPGHNSADDDTPPGLDFGALRPVDATGGQGLPKTRKRRTSYQFFMADEAAQAKVASENPEAEKVMPLMAAAWRSLDPFERAKYEAMQAAANAPVVAIAAVWEVHKDAEGHAYYLNTADRTTTWVAPDCILQDGWSSKLDPASGSTYYLNTNTNETTWVAPLRPGVHGALAEGDAPLQL